MKYVNSSIPGIMLICSNKETRYNIAAASNYICCCPQLSKIHLTSVQPMLMNLMEIRYYSL